VGPTFIIASSAVRTVVLPVVLGQEDTVQGIVVLAAGQGVVASELIRGAATDVVGLLVLIWLYSRRHSGRELLMVYTCFNIGLFAALAEITSGKFPAGVGFGLFGVLSIIRLRSRSFSNAEIGYFFLALVLALVNGLPGRDPALALALSAAVLVAVGFADHPSLHPTVHTTRLTLDRAYSDSVGLRDAVRSLIGGEVVEVSVVEVDAVRDTTRVAVRYRRDDGSPVAELVPLDAESSDR
jgi:Domain of unknown function (DUF4956)